MKKCKLLVNDSSLKENIWIDGEIISKQNSYTGENFPYRYNVKTINGIYEACSPECIKESSVEL